MRRAHDRVHGRLRGGAGRWPAGSAYSAHDPEAQAWVLLTLADTSELVFERLVRRFHPGEREDLWRDWRAFGLDFGIPGALLPKAHAGYRERLEATLESDMLAVTATSRALAETILRPRVPLLPRRTWEPAVSLTAALLPARLRAAYGLAYGPRQRLEGEIWLRAQRATWALAPRARRALPSLYASVRRVVRPAWLEG